MKTQVLFVDDEVNVLNGLRRMLRNQRNVWDMYFANGGETALETMSQRPIDVIVTDMRMPAIDGAELLSRVSKLYPHTVRLVLSGQSEQEKILRVVGPAHQFLAKPCDPDLLIETVNRARKIKSQLSNEALVKVVSQIDSLPSLPSVYRELVAEQESDQSSMDRVGEIIGRDLAMSAKVLKLVNSSFFGLPQHVACPKHAVSLLGLNIIRPLALSAHAFSQYGNKDLAGLRLEESVRHGLAVAVLSRRIARALGNGEAGVDDAFIGGMMHDIGKLILAAKLPDLFLEAQKVAEAKRLPLWQAELEVMGATHADIGAHLLALWGLPNSIVEAVAFHHCPSKAGSSSVAPLTAVHIANIHAQQQTPNGSSAVSSQFDQDYLRELELEERVDQWEPLTSAEVTL